MKTGAAGAAQLRQALIEALYPIKAYELADVCTSLGLKECEDGENPFDSKTTYIRRRVAGLDLAALVDVARQTLDNHADTESLRKALALAGAQGVDGELKNLIFAADGPKPRIVLRDAINNVIEIVEHAEHCLVYDRPLGPEGLTWGTLVDWWAKLTDAEPSIETARELYRRLYSSLDSPPERLLFEAYGRRLGASDSGQLPALVPQVYLHYDPYTRRELQRIGPEVLARQRMDFLLLLPGRVRIVLEVDGQQHYSRDGKAAPALYAEMVREDRQLRLSGYEVYRFGGAELSGDHGVRLAAEFFDALLQRHAPAKPA